jgi:hypothetical protein
MWLESLSIDSCFLDVVHKDKQDLEKLILTHGGDIFQSSSIGNDIIYVISDDVSSGFYHYLSLHSLKSMHDKSMLNHVFGLCRTFYQFMCKT